MASHHRRPLTFGEHACRLWYIVQGISKLPIEFITHLAISRQHQWGFKRGLAVAVLRSFKSPVIVPWLRNLSQTTGDSIREKCVEKGWIHHSKVLKNTSGPDATIHEIVFDETTIAAPIVLYFHGGGYQHPINEMAHIPLAHELGTQLRASSVFFLEYTLTPEAQYPTQLQQAVLAWQHLVTERKIKAERVLLAGDSAGAHLALSLVSHSMQPCPGVKPVTHLGQDHRLKGLLLLSPWITMTYDALSFRQFDHVDFLTTERCRLFAQRFQPRPGEVWAEPLSADKSFWARLPVQNLFITCGSAEVLRDAILDFYSNIEEASSNDTKCVLVLADGEVHAHPALDYPLGVGPCESRRRFLEWCKSLR